MMVDEELYLLAQETLTASRAKGWLVVTAESCTGGLISGALTEISGSSDVVEGGFVTYSNAAKSSALGVSAALISRVGAVSAEVAAAMAEGALSKLTTATLAIAVTGIAGPSGGSSEKPVGLVHFGLAIRDRPTRCWHQLFAGNRHRVRRSTVISALDAIIGAAKAD